MNDLIQIIGVLGSMLLALTYLWLLGRYTHYWKHLPKVETGHSEKVRVLIVFRNEAEHLPRLIRSIEALSYPSELLDFVWVDDHSSDESVALIREGMKKYAYEIISEEGEGKKAGLRQGWKHIGQGLILQTDADCILPQDWVQQMIAPFNETQVRFVSGPVAYGKGSTFFQRWLRIDFAGLVSIGGSHIAWKRPLLCNGANLAFRLDSIPDDLMDDKASGDDVFLMQSIAEQDVEAVRFVKQVEALVLTEAPEDFRSFFHQRLRWASKNTRYSDRTNLAILWLTWLMNLVMLINLLLWQPYTHLALLFMLVIKLLAEGNFLYRVSKDIPMGAWHWTHLLGQVFHIPYMALMPILSTFVPYQWKERRLR